MRNGLRSGRRWERTIYLGSAKHGRGTPVKVGITGIREVLHRDPRTCRMNEVGDVRFLPARPPARNADEDQVVKRMPHWCCARHLTLSSVQRCAPAANRTAPVRKNRSLGAPAKIGRVEGQKNIFRVKIRHRRGRYIVIVLIFTRSPILSLQADSSSGYLPAAVATDRGGGRWRAFHKRVGRHSPHLGKGNVPCLSLNHGRERLVVSYVVMLSRGSRGRLSNRLSSGGC